MVTASQINSVRMCVAIDQPITSLVHRSITVARYNQPSHVRMYVLCAAAHNTYSAQSLVMCSSMV